MKLPKLLLTVGISYTVLKYCIIPFLTSPAYLKDTKFQLFNKAFSTDFQFSKPQVIKCHSVSILMQHDKNAISFSMDGINVTFRFERSKCIVHDSSKGTRASPLTISLSKNASIKGRRVFVMFDMFYAILDSYNDRFLLKFEDESALYCFRDGVFISIAKTTGHSPKLPLVLTSLDALEETLSSVDSFYSVTTGGITRSRCRIGKADFEFAFNHYSGVGGIHLKKKNFTHFDLNPLHVEGALYREQEEQFEMCGISVPLNLVKLVSYAMVFEREGDRFSSALNVPSPFIYPAFVLTNTEINRFVCNISKVKWIFHKGENEMSISDYINSIPLDNADDVDDWNMLNRVTFIVTSSSMAHHPRCSRYELLKRFKDSHLKAIGRNEFLNEPEMKVNTFEARISFIQSEVRQPVNNLSDTECRENLDEARSRNNENSTADDENLENEENSDQDNGDKNFKIEKNSDDDNNFMIGNNPEHMEEKANPEAEDNPGLVEEANLEIKINTEQDNHEKSLTEESTKGDDNYVTEDNPEQSEWENIKTVDIPVQDDEEESIAEDELEQNSEGENIETADSLEQDEYYDIGDIAEQGERERPKAENNLKQAIEKEYLETENNADKNEEDEYPDDSTTDAKDISDKEDEYPDEWNDEDFDNDLTVTQHAQPQNVNDRENVNSCISDIEKQIEEIEEIIVQLGPEQETTKLEWRKDLNDLYRDLQWWQDKKLELRKKQSKLPNWARKRSSLDTIWE